MNILAELRRRFADVLTQWVDDPRELAEMVRPSQDPRHGDYQANCAMPLGKIVGKPPRDLAADMVAALKLDDLCEPPEVAGPGFINLRLKTDWLAKTAATTLADPQLGVVPAGAPGAAAQRTIVIDYSAPNVAKPMHVGHIRSTVIGDALTRILRFAGHQVITDNHLGDWGTQFGMIIYGYKHFRDEAAYRAKPVSELARLYKLVNQLVEFHEGTRQLPQLEARVAELEAQHARAAAATPVADKAAEKKAQQALRKLKGQLDDAHKELQSLQSKLAKVQTDPQLSALAMAHPRIGVDVLVETSKLHIGDAEN
ncbi:MAG: arginine--tRNA ligase, partial [Planctomycetes bacterium]|nr:arginine--tRNA ligase [Planctomycetota bacterium]